MIRGLMSDEEWACLEPFVIERGARSDRRPRDHRLVLDEIFLDCTDGRRQERSESAFWQMGVGLPPVPALDSVRLVGVAARSV